MRTTNIPGRQQWKRNGYLVSELSVRGHGTLRTRALNEVIGAAKAIEDEGYTTDSWSSTAGCIESCRDEAMLT